MLTSLAYILLLGMIMSKIFSKMGLPGLVGMIFTGIVLSPHALNLLDTSLLSISADLRQLALIIILTRAGLSLDFGDLKKAGRPAILMCFVPATLEILGTVILAPKILGITHIEAFLMGTVLGAVSPAIIVPRMLLLMENGYGTDKQIPQTILAGASVDDIYVIVLFTAAMSVISEEKTSPLTLIQIPVSVVMGIVIGIALGFILTKFFKKFHMRDTVKVMIILSISFLLIELENRLKGIFPISGLLAIMSVGMIIYNTYKPLAKRLSVKYTKLWVFAEVMLFVLVGAQVDLSKAVQYGAKAILVVVCVTFFRVFGVFICFINTKLCFKERLFCAISALPKATVQAAIGALPLAAGLDCGEKILSASVLSILIMAPIGGFLIDKFYKRLLTTEKPISDNN
ncbi:MAG: cation:proton antiporter [Oscillospiraceae bacterium]